MRKKALVIGYGASGIAGVRELRKFGFNVSCYEVRERTGGVWLYDENPAELDLNFDDAGRPIMLSSEEYKSGFAEPASAMYANLHSNLPHPLMSYRGRAFEKGTPLYCKRDAVTEYLQSAGKDNEDLVIFRRMVLRVYHAAHTWHVISKDLGNGRVYQEEFDKILTCNGHYNTPYVPFIEGLWKWKRKVRHSRTYRKASELAQETVLVVGGKPSGYDITRELATYFLEHELERHPKVYQSVRNTNSMFSVVEGPPAQLVTVVAEMAKVEEEHIVLKDGMVLDDVTLILFATGYLFSFPFFRETDEPFNRYPLTRKPTIPRNKETIGTSTYPAGGLAVHHLDRNNLFYLPAPSLAIVALHSNVVPFQLAEAQCRAVAYAWSGHSFIIERPLDLNSFDESPLKATFVLGEKQFPAENELMRLIGEGGSSTKEVTESGTFSDVASWRIGLRLAGNVLKKSVLGY